MRLKNNTGLDLLVFPNAMHLQTKPEMANLLLPIQSAGYFKKYIDEAFSAENNSTLQLHYIATIGSQFIQSRYASLSVGLHLQQLQI